MGSARVELAGLAIADPPARWEALGFTVGGGRLALGGVEVRLGDQGRGITGWTLRHFEADADSGLDGLATTVTAAPVPVPDPAPGPVAHPNGAIGIDHVVVLTPNFDRMTDVLAGAEMPLRRIRDAGGFRQGFRRLGPVILELVEAPSAAATAFWGLVVVVSDLDALGERLGAQLGEVRPTVQPGRHIATLAASAGLSARIAFMDAAPA